MSQQREEVADHTNHAMSRKNELDAAVIFQGTISSRLFPPERPTTWRQDKDLYGPLSCFP
jgi:hypothetical protein